MSMKNSSDTIGNRTRDLSACSAVPQPTALPCAPVDAVVFIKNTKVIIYKYCLLLDKLYREITN